VLQYNRFLAGEAQVKQRVFFFLVTCAALFFVAVSVSIYVLGSAELNARETGLLGLVLTIFSLVVGAIITHIYSTQARLDAIREVTEFHQKNLRIYALKAAEKVNNLSKELGRLSAYLEQELQETDYGGTEEELSAKEERIQSAIHLISALKSVNDTALSDWQGVIGEEINEQRERAGQREETLRQVVDRLAALEALQREDVVTNPDIAIAPLQEQLEILRRDVRALAGELGAPFLSTTRRHSPKHLVQSICPSCANPLSFGQKPRDGSKKAITCKKCDTDLISEYSEDTGFTLRLRRELQEEVLCPSCNVESIFPIDEWHTASTTVTCPNCANSIRLARSTSGLRINLMPMQGAKYKATEEVILQVKAELPQQPWPKGIDKTVAEKLQVPLAVVRKAIQQLIYRGDFMDQYDGQVMTTAEKIKLVRSIGTDL
jgi:RNase P subunit RPR2